MKNSIRLVIVCFTILTCGEAMAVCRSLQSLSWMEGIWATENEDRQIIETWIRISGDTFEGSSEFRPAQGASTYESLRLVLMSGDIFYLAKVPQNKLPVAFKLTECEENKAVFENPAHDFPQALSYSLGVNGILNVSVTGQGGQDFDLKLRQQ